MLSTAIFLSILMVNIGKELLFNVFCMEITFIAFCFYVNTALTLFVRHLKVGYNTLVFTYTPFTSVTLNYITIFCLI